MTRTRSLVAAEGNQVSSSKTRRGSRRQGMPLEPVIVAPVAHEAVAVASTFKISICKKDSLSLSLSFYLLALALCREQFGATFTPVCGSLSRTVFILASADLKFVENSLQNKA